MGKNLYTRKPCEDRWMAKLELSLLRWTVGLNLRSRLNEA